MYVVEVKRSAWRRWGPAGEWVNRHGRRRTFDSRADARAWAGAVGGVWVQDAVPHDASGVDGYLVATQRTDDGSERATDGSEDGVGTESGAIGEQVDLVASAQQAPSGDGSESPDSAAETDASVGGR